MKGKIKVSFSLSMYFDIFLALEARWENKFREKLFLLDKH